MITGFGDKGVIFGAIGSNICTREGAFLENLKFEIILWIVLNGPRVFVKFVHKKVLKPKICETVQ